MKRLISFLFTIALAVTLSAQSDSERMAMRAYAEEEYADAVELYKAAIALSSEQGTKEMLEKKLANARACLTTRSKAAASYSEGKYEEALGLYRKLAEYNRKDSQAQMHIALIEIRLEEEKRAAEERKRMEQIIGKEYLPALKGSLAAKKDFAARYPGTHEAGILLNIIELEDKFSTTNRDDLLLEIGMEYLKYGIKPEAWKYFNASAGRGNPEALYQYAQSAFPRTSKQWITMMALSAEGGHSLAAEELKKSGKQYSRTSAQSMYRHLIAYRSSLASARYVRKNAEYYYLNLNVSSAVADLTDETDLTKASADDLYDMAELQLMNNSRKMLLYRQSAFKGNVDAMYKYATLYPTDDPQVVRPMLFISYYYGIDSAKDALSKYLLNGTSDKENFRSYMKYILSGRDIDMLRKNNVRLFDALMFAVYPLKSWCSDLYDKNDALLLYSATSFYDKNFWKNHKTTVWDSAIVAEAKKALSYHQGDSDFKKIAKKLDKADSAPGLYSNPLYLLLKNIKPEALHRHADSTPKENIFGPVK